MSRTKKSAASSAPKPPHTGAPRVDPECTCRLRIELGRDFNIDQERKRPGDLLAYIELIDGVRAEFVCRAVKDGIARVVSE